MQKSNYRFIFIYSWFVRLHSAMSFRCNPRGCIVVHLLTSRHEGTNSRLLSQVIFSLLIAKALLRSLKASLPSPPSSWGWQRGSEHLKRAGTPWSGHLKRAGTPCSLHLERAGTPCSQPWRPRKRRRPSKQLWWVESPRRVWGFLIPIRW